MNGPCTIFLTETQEEKDAAWDHITELNKDIDRFYKATHIWVMIIWDEEAKKMGKRKPGRMPSKEVWIRDNRFV
jgi:hypothetical protein